MTYNFAKQQAQRVARRTIITRVILIVLLVGLQLTKGNNLQNLFGPYAQFTDSSQLAGLEKSRKHYVETEAELLFDTSYVMTVDGKDNNYYYAFWAGDELILAETGLDMTEAEYTNYTVRGRMALADSDERDLVEGVLNDMADATDSSVSEARMLLSPYIIHTTADPWGLRVMVFAGLAALLVALLRIVQAISGLADYHNTKSFKKLEALGTGGAEWVNDAISAEIAQGRVLFREDSLIITDNWVIEQKSRGFGVWPKAEVVWVYRTVTRHRTNGIPTGKSHSVNLGMADGKTILEVSARNEAKAQQSLDALEHCGLAAVFGFSPDWQQLYQSDTPRFIALARQAPGPEREPAGV